MLLINNLMDWKPKQEIHQQKKVEKSRNKSRKIRNINKT